MQRGMSNQSSKLSDPSIRHALVGPGDLWSMKRRFQICFLRQMGLLPSQKLLDLGCGTLRGGIPIIDYLDHGNYTGVEVRKQVLEEGRRELIESGLSHKEPDLIHCQRLDTLDLGRTFDVAWAFAILIHMNDAILEQALSTLCRHLNRHGVFFTTVNIGDNPEGIWQGFPIIWRHYDFYIDIFRRFNLVVEDIGPLTAFGHLHPRRSASEQLQQRMLKATFTGAYR